MEKIDKNTRIKLLAILLLSNICIYLLSTGSDTNYLPQEQNLQRKQDYIVLKITADLKTNFEPNRPISITNSRRSKLIPYAVLLDETNNENQNITDLAMGKKNTNAKFLTIYVHKKYINFLLKDKDLIILPFKSDIQITKYNRRNYEVTY